MNVRVVYTCAAALALIVAAAGCTPAAPDEAQVLSTDVPAATATPAPTMTPFSEEAGVWIDVTEFTIGETEEWTNKVELADVNGDGLVDLLFANGGDYDVAGQPEFSRVFLNQSSGAMYEEATEQVFGAEPTWARVVKVRDVNSDGHADVVLGTTFQTQSRLYLGDGAGNFDEVTDTNLPALDASIGDLELGDVDGDGDLDMVLADWGPGSPMTNEGGRTLLWLNDGAGRFSDATDTQMPDVLVKFSWELELVDVDNDYDLDALVSCKMCDGSFLFQNDGAGNFVNVSSSNMPQFPNNYEFEAMDLNGDGYLDLVTLNDGNDFSDHVFINDGSGVFTDATESLWPTDDNPPYDDNMVAFLDYDSDGDADFLIGSLNGPDRVLINDGSGHLTMETDWFVGVGTPTTLGIAVADLNKDGKLDVVQGQGESPLILQEHVYFGQDIRPDTAPPVISLVEDVAGVEAGQPIVVRARIHDNKSPTMPHDWQTVSLRRTVDGETTDEPMQWYGEYLWRAVLDSASDDFSYQVCATDAVGNEACSPLLQRSN